jgi:hypothetical protein
LNPVIGYEKGAAIAKKAYAEGLPIREVAAKMTDLPADELARLLDPADLARGRGPAHEGRAPAMGESHAASGRPGTDAPGLREAGNAQRNGGPGGGSKDGTTSGPRTGR